MAEQIIFAEYQAEVFNEAEQLLKTQGYLGEQLFEDTYVLQKRLAEWVISNVPVSNSANSLMGEAMNAYNGVLGIATDDNVAPVIDSPAQSEPIRPVLTASPTPPTFRPTIRPVKMIPKPAISTPVAVAPPRPIVRPIPTSATRPQQITRPVITRPQPLGGGNTVFGGGINPFGTMGGGFGGFGGGLRF